MKRFFFFLIFAYVYSGLVFSASAQSYVLAQDDLEEAITAEEGETTPAEEKPEDVTFDQFDESGEKPPPAAETPTPPVEESNEVDQDLQPLEETPSQPVAPLAPPMEETPPVVESPAPTPDPTPIQNFSDDPDLALEAQLHDIYLNFHSKPTSSEQWQAVLGERTSEVYAIQKGDTLWGISKTLFGDGNYWPKIWSINGKIKNPHLVEPGYQIRFIMGDETDAPAFTITEKNAADFQEQTPGPSVTTTESDGSETLTGTDIEIPPPLKVSNPVVMKLPPSLPKWQSQDRGRYNDLGIDFGRRTLLDVKDVFPVTDFVMAKPPPSFGEVMEIETGSEIAGAFQYIYIKGPENGLNAGEKYLVVANRGKLRSPNRFVDTDGAIALEIQGEVEIVENVRSVDDISVIYRALVLSSVNPVSVGSMLMKGTIQNVYLNRNGARSNVVSQIIGGQFDNRRLLFGQSSLVFLNRGTRDGLGEGQVLPIRSNRQVRFPGTKLRQNNLPIGFLQIAKVEEDFSTAIVISAWDEVRAGDFTGEGDAPLKIDDANTLGTGPTSKRPNPEEESFEENLDTIEE